MRIWIPALAIVILSSGCWGEPRSSPESPKKKTEQRSLDPVSTPLYAGEDTKEKIAKSIINPAIRGFQEAEGRNPASLDELVQKQYLRALPPVPAGRKFTYNPDTGEFDVVPKD